MHLERQGLYLHGPSFRDVLSPSNFSEANQLPPEVVQSPGDSLPGLPGRPSGVCFFQGPMSERSPLSQRAPGKAGIYRQLGEIPALSIVVSRVVGSQGGCQEPKLGLACGQDLQDHRHGVLLPNHQTEAFLGQLAFACQIGPDLNLQKKLLGLILHQFHSRESPLPLPPETLEALAWWASPENLSKWFPFGQWAPSCLVWPDACETGWEVTIRRVLGQRGHGNPTRVLFT